MTIIIYDRCENCIYSDTLLSGKSSFDHECKISRFPNGRVTALSGGSFTCEVVSRLLSKHHLDGVSVVNIPFEGFPDMNVGGVFVDEAKQVYSLYASAGTISLVAEWRSVACYGAAELEFDALRHAFTPRMSVLSAAIVVCNSHPLCGGLLHKYDIASGQLSTVNPRHIEFKVSGESSVHFEPEVPSLLERSF